MPEAPAGARLEPVRQAVEQYGPGLLGIPGVLAVRPGYRVRGGRLTEEPAVVAVVAAKKNLAAVPPGEQIPGMLGGVPVDVQVADPLELLAPRRLDSWGWVFDPAAVPEAALTLGYTRPVGISLDPAEVGNILCHVGPDAGWATLAPFLAGTRERLTVAMYDYYAEHIIKALEDLGRSASKPSLRLTLILQVDPSKEDSTVARLSEAWGGRLDFTPAVVDGPHRIFKNSYHTKVAVRDGTAFWLSSGNWTPTSQPVIPAGNQPTIYNRGNREYHVIIEDETLAGIFEGYIRHDVQQAKDALAEGAPEAAPEMPDLLVPEAFFLEAEAAVLQPHPFAPARFPVAGGDPIHVQPVMTPDNYGATILPLIEQATTSLYLQFSYVRAPREADDYGRLIDAVARKIEEGVDVRIIAGSFQKTEDTQALQARGWSLDHFRYQKSKLHNKTILVDAEVAVVGSQNWSPDGTQYNRDASLIFHSPGIARYFEEVFRFDWENLTKPASLPEITPELAPEAGATPPGKVRIPWRTWFGE